MDHDPRYTAEAAEATMRRINKLWLDGNLEELASTLDPQIAMVFPGFTGGIQGREAVLAGFREFCSTAMVHGFVDTDYRCDVVSDTAVVTFKYDMVYEQNGKRYASTGRDLWVFRTHADTWMAVWRTMIDVQETALE
jgi:hypothetical protein